MAATNGVPQTDLKQSQSPVPGDRRNQVMLGELPNDFLRTGAPRTQEQEDERIAQILHAQQQAGVNVVSASNFAGRLSISVVQAKLNKNYGITKMDPYCRIRIGHTVFESPTAYNGAKNPIWNKTVTTYLPIGVDSMYVEIFDERSFTMDDRIAWAHVKIPDAVMNRETVDEWYPLSGRLGDEKEGMINLVLSLTASVESNVYSYSTFPTNPIVPMMVPTFYPPASVMVGQAPAYQSPAYQAPAYQAPAYPLQQPTGPVYTEEDLKQVKDMFPNMEEEVVKSVLEANRGVKDATINSLLAMSSD